MLCEWLAIRSIEVFDAWLKYVFDGKVTKIYFSVPNVFYEK